MFKLTLPMMYTTTLTQKGQVTIPQVIRNYLGLKPYQKVSFVKKNDLVYIVPANNFLALKNSIKTKTKFDDTQADKQVLNLIKKKYKK